MKISIGKVNEDGFPSAPIPRRRKAVLGAGRLLFPFSLLLTQTLACPHSTTGIIRNVVLFPPWGKWVASPEVGCIRKMMGLDQEQHWVTRLFLTASTLVQSCQVGAERKTDASAMARSYRFRAERSQVRPSNHGDNNNSICICPEMTGWCEGNRIKPERTQTKWC